MKKFFPQLCRRHFPRLLALGIGCIGSLSACSSQPGESKPPAIQFPKCPQLLVIREAPEGFDFLDSLKAEFDSTKQAPKEIASCEKARSASRLTAQKKISSECSKLNLRACPIISEEVCLVQLKKSGNNTECKVKTILFAEKDQQTYQ